MDDKKQYSKSLEERTTDAKHRIISFLTPKWNVEVKKEDNETKIFCRDKETNEMLFKLVMELRFSWKGFDFPYETVTIPHRKKKLMEEDIQIFYMVLNEFGNEILITTKENILSSNIITKDTMYTTKEKFYEVQLGKFKKGFDNLEEYIKSHLKDESQRDNEEDIKEFLRPIIMYLCPNCETVSQVGYKPGLLCPICNTELFNK